MGIGQSSRYGISIYDSTNLKPILESIIILCRGYNQTNIDKANILFFVLQSTISY